MQKTIDLSQITDKIYHIMLHTSPWSRFELTTSVVTGTDFIGSCKFNYHTIMATIWNELENKYVSSSNRVQAVEHFIITSENMKMLKG